MWRNRWSLRYRGLECPAGSSCSSKQWEVVGPLPSFCPCHLEGFLRAADAQSLPWVPLLFLGGGGECLLLPAARVVSVSQETSSQART